MVEGIMSQIGEGCNETNLNWFDRYLDLRQPTEKLNLLLESLSRKLLFA